jgi:hypothetical protein
MLCAMLMMRSLWDGCAAPPSITLDGWMAGCIINILAVGDAVAKMGYASRSLPLAQDPLELLALLSVTK